MLFFFAVLRKIKMETLNIPDRSVFFFFIRESAAGKRLHYLRLYDACLPI